MVAGCGHMHDLGAAGRLRVPDLGDGGKIKVADDYLVARAAEVERAGQDADGLGYRGDHGNFIGRGIDQLGETVADLLEFVYPQLPRRA